MDGILHTNGGPTRRTVLQAGVAWAVAQSASRISRADTTDPRPDRTLVLLHLSGGNDGLNTLIPYADPLYYELRPRLGRVARKAIPVDDQVAFHPSLSALLPVFERGGLAVVQGVGYREPDYSHVGSCRIWATGAQDTASRRAWWDDVLGRLGADAARVGGEPPVVMTTAAPGWNGHDAGPRDVLSSATNPAPYRSGEIEETLAAVVRLVASKRRLAMVFATVGGFDTHADQLEAHEEVLRRLGDGLAAFQHELERAAIAERVVLMAWSEFGRRPAENATGGTDHGTAGPVFLLGKNVRGGLHGAMPSLADTDFGSLIPTVDFRDLYTVLAERWLGLPPAAHPVKESVRNLV